VIFNQERENGSTIVAYNTQWSLQSSLR